MTYQWLKTIHIISATVLFGVGIGSAFYKFWADRTRDVAAIAFVNKTVALVDWFFVSPSVVIQPITGILMAHIAGIPLTSFWLTMAIALYVLGGSCWVVAVILQIRMRKIAESALLRNTILPSSYNQLVYYWIWLGIGGFIAVLAIFPLMVIKPQ